MANLIPISTVIIGGGGSSTLEFNNIPQSYTDLSVRLSMRSTFSGGVADDMLIKFNDSTSGFTNRYIYGDGSLVRQANAYGNFGGNPVGANATATTFSNIEVCISNYTGSNQKSYIVDSVSENNGTETYTALISGINSTTSPIQSITFYTASSFTQYSSATLYGIRKY